MDEHRTHALSDITDGRAIVGDRVLGADVQPRVLRCELLQDPADLVVVDLEVTADDVLTSVFEHLDALKGPVPVDVLDHDELRRLGHCACSTFRFPETKKKRGAGWLRRRT